MWASLLAKLQPEVVRRRSSCFERLAAAVLDGSFDFANATLEAGAPADALDSPTYVRDLASLLASHEDGARAAPIPLPAALTAFRSN